MPEDFKNPTSSDIERLNWTEEEFLAIIGNGEIQGEGDSAQTEGEPDRT